MRPSQLLSTALALSSLSVAWPWPESFDDIKGVADVGALLYGRADSNSDYYLLGSASATPTASVNSAAQTTSSPKTSDSGSSVTTGDSAAATSSASAASSGGSSMTITGSQEATKTSGKVEASAKANSTIFDPRLPAGGIQMITPAAISGPQFYKIGDWVTFAWNYTSLSVTPTAIDILATCTANQGTYTLAVNQTVGETGRVLWDTGSYQASNTLPLLTETYTLVIYDADSSISATAQAGYLAVYNQYTFGMYTPQPYTPWANFTCPTCNSALSSTERQTLGFMLVMCTITVLSFTWFAGDFGVF
ncbi:hypothetical protein K432DRAFT_468206 [Lepidopterella palustris CBS 459.81]|uniref:DUF7137 domain-containing protein n=1 Tax=Lepidopterella palustris CBS 459.81 TaxID=1314670 RepID=A0A8E2EG19_9PEZI|nr:hypothetical protein K432DRAFT_468206 [Lepidopterella palustris CBS 459.81]